MSQSEMKTEKKKGFLAKLMDALDKKMEAKAKNASCCCCSPAGDSNKKTCS